MSKNVFSTSLPEQQGIPNSLHGNIKIKWAVLNFKSMLECISDAAIFLNMFLN